MTESNTTDNFIDAQPKISVIIPVYNVSKWLRRAAESLQKQIFTEYDVWLVDDGSTDDSGKICDEICAKDKRFNVIHQENAGAAAARNAAFGQASGKYFYFMDPDDWCEPTMLGDMYHAAERHNLELLIAGFYIDTYYSDTEYYREYRTSPDVIFKDQKDFRANAHKLFDKQLLYAPWNKLYLSSYLKDNNILFPKTFWDDLPFNLDVIRNVEKVGCISGQYYHFLRARAEAENTKYRPDMYEKREEEHQWIKDLYNGWGLESDEIKEFLARRYSERLIGCVENVTNKSCTLSSKEKRQEVKRIISTPQARRSYKLTKPNSTMMKIMLLPYKMQNTTLVIAESKFISWVKGSNTKTFAKLKANR